MNSAISAHCERTPALAETRVSWARTVPAARFTLDDQAIGDEGFLGRAMPDMEVAGPLFRDRGLPATVGAAFGFGSFPQSS